LAIGDTDGDGWPDILPTMVSAISPQQRDGTFETSPAAAKPRDNGSALAGEATPNVDLMATRF
jgi:hypothetical protein